MVKTKACRNKYRRGGGQMISKNRKGQLGKIIVSLPILILLVIIMGAFVFLSITFSGLKAPAEQSAVSLADAKENLLLKTPVLSVSEKEPEEILNYNIYEEKLLTNTIKSGEIQREIKHYLGPC